MLPAPEPRDGRLLRPLRARAVPGLHGLHAGRDQVRRARRRADRDGQGRPGRKTLRDRGLGRAAHEDPDRDQRGRVPVAGRQRRHALEPLRLSVPARRAERLPRRERGLVASRHVDVPPRQRDPPRDEHALPLVDRRAGGTGDRARALRARLCRVRARRRGRRTALDRIRARRRSARRVRSSGSSAPRSSSSGSATTCSAAARSRSSCSTSRSRSRSPGSRSGDTWAGSSAARFARLRSRASARRTPRTDGRGSPVSQGVVAVGIASVAVSFWAVAGYL